MRGSTKWFNVKRGFGYITGEDQKDYFVHYSDINKDGFKKLDQDEEVTFDVEEAEKGLQAKNVVSIKAS